MAHISHVLVSTGGCYAVECILGMKVEEYKSNLKKRSLFPLFFITQKDLTGIFSYKFKKNQYMIALHYVF